MRSRSISEIFNATTFGYAQARAIGDAERRPIFYAGGGGRKSSHLLRAQNDWNPARLAHQRQTPDQIVPFKRHFKKNRSATTVALMTPGLTWVFVMCC